MRKRNWVALSAFVIFYLGFGVYLTLSQAQIIYRPSAQDFENCPQFASAEKITYQSTRMYVKRVSDASTVVLYHGNAGSACDRYFYADSFAQAGYGYVVVEYAGYSNDSVAPSHERVKQDVGNVVAYLKEADLAPIFVVGESIGTGAAAYHAALNPPKKLLLISPFTDLAAVARERFWFYPTSLLVENAFDNVAALHDYPGETTIIHGTADSLIPYRLGEALYHSLEGEKELSPIAGAGHNDLFKYEETYAVIVGFLE